MIEDLRDRLRRTRWPADFANHGWGYGVEGGYLRELVTYWAYGFDWYAHQDTMNRYVRYRTEVDGVPIHFFVRWKRGRLLFLLS